MSDIKALGNPPEEFDSRGANSFVLNYICQIKNKDRSKMTAQRHSTVQQRPDKPTQRQQDVCETLWERRHRVALE